MFCDMISTTKSDTRLATIVVTRIIEQRVCTCREDSSKLVAGGVGILIVVGALYAFLNSQF